jgi:hypothetical protein
MCCGSKRSGLSSASASRPPPRADRAPPRAEATPAPVMAGPIPPTQPVDAKEAAVFAPNPQFRRLATQREALAAPRPGRIWRLTS